ncbi:EAL domain-containing protein [Aquibium sp. ELW1220]|jgi:EAL domain-containing protein (putative c-di-GMP-specific phosphodiesterase class I)|uniref:EAL domain-containing protein n=1 Tax=Aquibium sp. ELW1220 TaxID=2976766 RepID=UPI0025B1F311|nr:EAL domain-containing protein [Aquibium sp. ELW1220]MDN2580706.1 EAL domain-containing protein [Aquibium sp. ELW1220]
MARSAGLAHIVRNDDGTSTGVWGIHVLKSAFQPIFAFEAGRLRIAAYEGLIRAFRDGEPVSPGSFFHGVPAVDRFHVETLTRTLHLLNAGACLDPEALLFVNFDPSLFSDRAVAEVALRDTRLVMHEAGIQPARIVCEMTEQKTGSRATLHLFVGMLRAHGFRIAVDDYGADDSDISRIDDLRPDIVKFDAKWISRLMLSGPGFALLRTMVSTFRERGIATVFEGIEETWQLEIAERCGASMVQGFVLARPELAPTSFSVFSRPVTAEAAPPCEAAAAPDRTFAQAVRPHPAMRAFGRRGSLR